MDLEKNARSFEEMSNLSKDLRQKLSEQFSLPAITVDANQVSSDEPSNRGSKPSMATM